MTPNLLVATQTLFSPHKWFKGSKTPRAARKTEHWDAPVPGTYEYVPGRGWYLVATDRTKDESQDGSQLSQYSDAGSGSTAPVESLKLNEPILIKYSRALKKSLLAPDYDARKREGKIKNDAGKMEEVGFFRLDDGVAWVQCWDSKGDFVPGPYKLWCIDQQTSQFRHMLKCDDPNYIPSRRNSYDATRARGRSQDSRSTRYRAGPGSQKDPASLPSTTPNSRANSRTNSRANSVRDLRSPPASQPGTRPTSPSRSPKIPLSESSTLLDPVAADLAIQARLHTERTTTTSSQKSAH